MIKKIPLTQSFFLIVKHIKKKFCATRTNSEQAIFFENLRVNTPPAIKIMGNDFFLKNTPGLTNNQSKLLCSTTIPKHLKILPVAPSMQNVFLWDLLCTAGQDKN